MKSKPRCPDPCPHRRPACQSSCETYAEMQAYNSGVKKYLSKGRLSDSVLIIGYIKRAAKVRAKGKKTNGRYRGT